MARQDERERVRRQLRGSFGEPRAEAGFDAPRPDTALTAERDAIRTPRWLDEQPERLTWWERLVPRRLQGARMDAGRRGVVTMAGIGLFALVVTVVVILWQRPAAQPVPPLPAAVPAELPADSPPAAPSPPASEADPGEQTPAELVVSVVGLVHNAGLVRLPPGARVADAIAAAGGTHAGADLAGLNLAQRLADGDQVQIGAADTATPPTGSVTVSGGTVTAAAPGKEGGAAAGGSPVDLNNATEAELEALPGVGPVTAKAIVAWRETNGRFTDVEQLTEVDGIGSARLARLRDVVTV